MVEFLDVGGEWLSLDKIVRVVESSRTPEAPYLIVHFQGVPEPQNFDGAQAHKIMAYLNKHRTQEWPRTPAPAHPPRCHVQVQSQ